LRAVATAEPQRHRAETCHLQIKFDRRCAWIGAAYWFTSSTYPAVTIARMFSDTFAGIAPASVPMFIVFQILGAALGAGLALLLHHDTPIRRDGADAVAGREERCDQHQVTGRMIAPCG
jgi:glycerol uptake facilitator-like aquaporin